MTRVLFLPGASGSGSFWQPVASRLPAAWQKVCLDWPGLGEVPPDPNVTELQDLLELILRHTTNGPVDLVAQSMGGLVAIQTALQRPHAVRRLVLTGTSGGIDLRPFDVYDWRPEYRAEFPDAARWITDTGHEDLAERLPEIGQPTLLLWGGADPISRPAVGAFLESNLPGARLVIVPGVDHMFVRDVPDQVAPLILNHLSL